MRIIEDILDTSKLEVGQLKLIDSEFNLFGLIHEIYDYYILKNPGQAIKETLNLNITYPKNLRNLKFNRTNNV
jgi:hypothetical protein